MMYIPRISIVTPNYNSGKYLEETILSVLDQCYPNLEYIIIDGGSTDNSVEIIKKYADSLTYWESEKDKGMYHAIQKGFEKSTGEIMAWINSDDIYHRNSLFSIAEIFSSFPEVNWIVGASTNIDDKGRTIFVNQSRKFSKFDFYNHDFKWLQQESVFWRRTLWEKAGSRLNTDLKYAGDFELWLRFFQHDLLYVTHALTGGFRFRTSEQISLEKMDDYLREAEESIVKINLNREDEKILANYRKVQKIVSWLKKLKILRTELITNRYRLKYYPSSPEIFFNRMTMMFEICKE